MTSAFTPFSVRVTARFERDYRKLLKDHPDISELYARVIRILAADPYNRSRTHPIKKLTSVKPGEGQYRIRFFRFRFIYDIESQVVFLKHCRLRREDTYT
jgi:mRNA-degrading endonuclease RelE of RelBE toxin-antitoxin system